MKKLYHLEYEETEQMFAEMHQMYFNNRNSYISKVIITFVGAFILFINVASNLQETLKPAFLVKFFGLWILAYVAAYLIVKHVAKPLYAKHAVKVAKEKFNERKELCGESLKVSADFYEDNFIVKFLGEEKDYVYKEVSHLYYTDTLLGFVVGGVYGEKAMLNFPRESLNKKWEKEFYRFIAEKCTNVAGTGFKEVK